MLDDLKVLTVGSAMVDTIAIVDSRHIERMSMKNADESFLLLAEGTKTDALEISTHTGGGAINAAVGLARLGADVATLAVLGRDQRGETILTRLISEGVSTRWVVRDDAATTGASVLVSSHDRNAAIFTYRGANGNLVPRHLKPDAFGVDLLYVASLSNKSADCFPAILEFGKRAKAFVATNPGKRQLSSRGDALKANLPNIDMLSINRTEADTLVPLLVADRGDGGPQIEDDGHGELPPLAVRGFVGGGYELSMREFFTRLLAFGVTNVVVTDGRHGAFLADRGSIRYCPVAKVRIAGTAGAGDAFGSTLAGCLARGIDKETALRSATANAGSVVGFIDTQSGLLAAAALKSGIEDAAAAMPVRRWRLGS